jgi:putative nucleotidyltransferase with HDIG domain
MRLEEQVRLAYEKTGIDQANRERINQLLEQLNKFDTDTYMHSMRVGLLASEIAAFMHLDPKPALYGGLLHDVGKAGIDHGILVKNGELTEDDMEDIKTHVLLGYNMIKDRFPFSAQVMVRHHTYQPKPYPERIPEPSMKLSEATRSTIATYSRILALADFYDALVTRKNGKFTGPHSGPHDALDIFIKHNKDQEYLIGELSSAGIFEKFYGSITPST